MLNILVVVEAFDMVDVGQLEDWETWEKRSWARHSFANETLRKFTVIMLCMTVRVQSRPSDYHHLTGEQARNVSKPKFRGIRGPTMA